jgi:hypothetical protein
MAVIERLSKACVAAAFCAAVAAVDAEWCAGTWCTTGAAAELSDDEEAPDSRRYPPAPPATHAVAASARITRDGFLVARRLGAGAATKVTSAISGSRFVLFDHPKG